MDRIIAQNHFSEKVAASPVENSLAEMWFTEKNLKI